MGGTGKTPCVLRLAETAVERGRRPGILTRGYGRGTLEKNLVLAPGAAVRPEYSGDEPQIFIRSGVAAVGIGADRFASGTLLLRNFGVDLLLLDDGFQHWKLARDVDVVLIDALNPLGGGGVFPLGRLREPVEALARADIILITRSQFSDLAPAIEQLAARLEPEGAGIPRGRRAAGVGGAPHRAASSRPASGLSSAPVRSAGWAIRNRSARTLARLGVEPVEWVEFEDHHRYRIHELRRIARSHAGARRDGAGDHGKGRGQPMRRL